MNAKISSPQQKDRLCRFYMTENDNLDRIDVLVATSLLEEGLDVPSCKLVVKFNETISSKQDIQCKGRARHSNSRYIHLIHEDDEYRQTQKLKKYKKFQENVEQQISEKKSNNLFDKTQNAVVLDPNVYDRGLYIAATQAFIFEKVALLKLHEIYNRHDFELNCELPWESFAESPFSKNNFEQLIFCGICGVWKVDKFTYDDIMDTDDGKCRLIIKRIKDSDQSMEGIFFVTNEKYEEQYKRYKICKRQRRKNDNERVVLPALPDKFGEIHLKYKTANKMEIKFIEKNANNVVLSGVISEDRNGIFIDDIVSLSKLESVDKLNRDPNAYACTYKLILKLRDIPQSFINNRTQNESAKRWVNNKLDMDKICNVLGVERECIQSHTKIISDMAVSFMVCLWRKANINNDIINDGELIKTKQMLSSLQNKISSDQCDWKEMDVLFVSNLLDQFKEIFGDDAKIYINKTEAKFLHIVSYKLPHYLRNRKQENDIPVWVKQKCKNIMFADDKYKYEISTFQECFPSKRSILCEFNISGLRLEKSEFEDRLDLLRREFIKTFGFIHLYLRGQSNWKKSNKQKHAAYKYDKLYQQCVTLPKLSEFYHHLPQITITGDIRFNFKSSRDSVAFKAIKHLYCHGILDENLRVVGRRKALRPMSMMGTNCCVMETIYHSNIKPYAFQVFKGGSLQFVDHLHSISFIDNDNKTVLYGWGLLLSQPIRQNIAFYIYPRDMNWINIDSVQSNQSTKKWKVEIKYVKEYDRTKEFDAMRLCYHTNLMSLLGYNDSINYNCSDKNCVVVPLRDRDINLKRMGNILLNPWSDFVNIDIMFLWGKELTLCLVNEHKKEIISLISSRNGNESRIELMEEIDSLPCVTPNVAAKWNIDKETRIIMIKFVSTVNQENEKYIPMNRTRTTTWKTQENQNDNCKKRVYKMSKAESVQRIGYCIKLKTEKLKKVLSYSGNDLRFMISHRDENMIQSHKWKQLNDIIADTETDGDISQFVVRNESTNSYYTDLHPTNLCLKSQIGAGYSYLDCIKNKTNINEVEHKIDENELLYSAAALPLRPKDATIRHHIKLKRQKAKRESGLLIAPQLCRIVPVSKKELFFSRYLCCSLWKFEKLLLLSDFACLLQEYIGIQYNIYLLFQCCSLPSTDMILHAGIGRIYFFGDQIIKYCASLEAYSTRKELNEMELTRFVHHSVSNNNLCDKTKQHKYLGYLISKEFDARKYEITNFSSCDETDYYRVTRKSIADIVEAMVAATFYNDFIFNSKALKLDIIDEPFGKLNFNDMAIGDCNAMGQCREFINHLLEFTFYQQPEYPVIALVLSQEIKFTADCELKQILDTLEKIKECMMEEEEEENECDEFVWTDNAIEILFHLNLCQHSTSKEVEDVIFEIHHNCISKQWDMENLKLLSLLNKVRKCIKKQEQFNLMNLKPKNEIYDKKVYELEYCTNGLQSIGEQKDEEKYEEMTQMKANPNIFIPACIRNKKFGYELYENIINFYNKHCVLSDDESTKSLLKCAIYKCISHLFVCQTAKEIIFYRNNFEIGDVEQVINKLNILCADDAFPVFLLRERYRSEGIELILKYKFNRKDLIFAATTHSALNIKKKSFCNYQRLEFIGDAAIGFCVTQYLFQTFIKFEQGRLSHSRAALVCNHYLSRKLMRRFKRYNLDIRKYVTVISRDRADLCQYIGSFDYDMDDFEFCLKLLTVSKMKQPYCAKIFADVYEALVGAILIDTNGNLQSVWNVIGNDFKLNESQIHLINKKYAESQMIQDQLSRLINQ